MAERCLGTGDEARVKRDPALGDGMRRDRCSETSMISMARANLERLKFNHALTPGSY